MGHFVYALCGITSLVCFVLLLRHYRQVKSGLLLRSSLAFLCFAAGNILLFFDQIVFPDVNLTTPRHLCNLVGAVILLIAVTGERSRDLR